MFPCFSEYLTVNFSSLDPLAEGRTETGRYRHWYQDCTPLQSKIILLLSTKFSFFPKILRIYICYFEFFHVILVFKNCFAAARYEKMLGAFRRAADNARGTTHVQEATRHRHHHPETAQVYWSRRRSRRQSHGPRVERRCTEDQGQVRHCFPQDTGNRYSTNATDNHRFLRRFCQFGVVVSFITSIFSKKFTFWLWESFLTGWGPLLRPEFFHFSSKARLKKWHPNYWHWLNSVHE